MRTFSSSLTVSAALTFLAIAGICTSSAAKYQSRKTVFISHRGENVIAPENTMSAFKLAWKKNSDGVETDVHLTKDGKIVCCHDDTTGRTANDNLEISKSTLTQLRKLDFGSWKNPEYKGEKIPLLSELLKAAPHDKLVYIEIKSADPDMIKPMVKVIKDSKFPLDEIRLISFHWKSLAKAKKLLPNVEAYALYEFVDKDAGLNRKPNSIKLLAMLNKTNFDGIDLQAMPQMDKRFVQTFHNAGKSFHVWTVDDPKEAQRLISIGVDSITSNRGAYLKKILR
ncbi:glycerophosphodiester phosphodiesterase [Lentisphaerota bacterium ZTH]|nr:glycerophosphodiester phosphodiesterase [Lentisphaerota bacterium]WET07044.1 glycerophosphodiester phosphodiesterase [Lentisphaerota bacterium ZTH]